MLWDFASLVLNPSIGGSACLGSGLWVFPCRKVGVQTNFGIVMIVVVGVVHIWLEFVSLISVGVMWRVRLF
jgi:hypothetical protein